MVTPEKQRHYHSDDSSDEDESEENTVIPARQAQFTVRLLLDFLPSNILEVFRYGVPSASGHSIQGGRQYN